jgi:endonuclease YncB( thermonuclease family)
VSYRLLAGEFVIRYPDQPRNGPEPDGDTIRFAPDTIALVEELPRISGRAPRINARGNVAVRLEAIDALETHFSGTHQELAGANAGRDRLLAGLGFTNVRFWPDLPNRVRSADQDSVRGHVLSNGVDADGRVVAFVHPSDAAEPDGADVWVDEERAGASVGARLLASGDAYPAFYATLPASLREPLAELSRGARRRGAGLWPRSTADPDGAAAIPDLATLETLVLWPKLFRRIVPYLAGGFGDFDGFDAWLRADPVDRDDELLLLDRDERARLHDIVRASGDEIALEAWPEDFVISPDPRP